MRKALLSSVLLAGAAFAASPALAQDTAAAAPAAPASAFTITGAADVSSQYRFRGISQSDNHAVFQGTFTIAHSSGFYLSTWGSSATGNAAVDLGGTEIDAYAGWTHTFKNGFTIDGGLYGYIYPGSSKYHAQLDSSGKFIGGALSGINQSYFEVYGDASKTLGPVTAKVGVNFAPNQNYFTDFATKTRHNAYIFGELGLSVPNFPVTIHSHLGHTAGGFDYAPIGNTLHQYFDYTVGASYKWKALTFDLSYVGTDLSRSDTTVFVDDGEGGVEAVRNNDFRRAAKGVVVGTVTASF